MVLNVANDKGTHEAASEDHWIGGVACKDEVHAYEELPHGALIDDVIVCEHREARVGKLR